ncbi:hypothetical protein [Amycolatopsis sp. PS_44_ISF1]|uniref:hypothetical protein n=1 Tax=Amycolatopsis sp. PS_44_ISF1 TaxID=2974917 RepID=UPI0028E05FFF|nr:hypothetical protein [Amycolatopsis sp. PS_44_ISF1]MDT8915222.1 hypothetical protein [Amycolatopsis sp. PS_44_ISF1]
MVTGSAGPSPGPPAIDIRSEHLTMTHRTKALPRAVPGPATGRTFPGKRLAVLGCCFLTGSGVETGFHRTSTHGGFEAGPGLRIAPALADGPGAPGPVIGWVATVDRDGRPRYRWRFGTRSAALVKGVRRGRTSTRRSAPDLVDDAGSARRLSRLTAVPPPGPALLGGPVTTSRWGALTGFSGAGLVRVVSLRRGRAHRLLPAEAG